MAVKIWYQTMSPLSRLGAYFEYPRAHAEASVSEGNDIYFNGASEKYYESHLPADIFGIPYTKHEVQRGAIGFSRRAEQERFDAVLLAF